MLSANDLPGPAAEAAKPGKIKREQTLQIRAHIKARNQCARAGIGERRSIAEEFGDDMKLADQPREHFGTAA